jgi:hypothetical protein
MTDVPQERVETDPPEDEKQGGDKSSHDGESDHFNGRDSDFDHERSTPDLGHFAEEFARTAAESLDRLSSATGDPRIGLEADEAWERYKELVDRNARVPEFGLLSSVEHQREALQFVALSYALSTQWKARGNQTFCNVFVYDVGTQAGMLMPTSGGVPANTQMWASGGVTCWSQVDRPQGGDAFVAYDPNATKGSTHHMGIVIDPENKTGISAGLSKVGDYQSWEYDSAGTPRYVTGRDQKGLADRAEVRFYEYRCRDYNSSGFRRYR